MEAISKVNLGRKLQSAETALMSSGVGGTWTSVKTMTKGVEADRRARIPAVRGGFVKNGNEIPKYVTQARAAYLLGLPVQEYLPDFPGSRGRAYGENRGQRRMGSHLRRAARRFACWLLMLG